MYKFSSFLQKHLNNSKISHFVLSCHVLLAKCTKTHCLSTFQHFAGEYIYATSFLYDAFFVSVEWNLAFVFGSSNET